MKHGIVIPCYNEANRLNQEAFLAFAKSHPEFKLCFVNDGSTDNTLEVLHTMSEERKNQIIVYDMPANGGKAEAVRHGMIYLQQYDLLTLGFLDADLSTDFNDYIILLYHLDISAGGKKMVFGSRKSGNTSGIQRSAFRSIASDSVGMMIQSLVQLPIADTQCGAKIFSPELADYCFRKPFETRWLFDVELFIRIKRYYGKEYAMEKICEVPLKKWVEMEGSKITASDSLKMPAQLMKIFMKYEVEPALATTPKTLRLAGSRLMASMNLL
jgi:glycosyltransferase involved in cell wall biosynthesis